MMRLFLAAAILLCVIGSSFAHSWYSAACCSGLDCKPVAADDVRHNTDGGYTYIPTGDTFTKDMERPSQDGNFHVCVSEFGGENGEVWRTPRCIYVPMFW